MAMGLLSQGSPLSWEETQRHADHVRLHGILQFLHIYHAVKDRHKDVLKWGDEVSARPPPPRAPLFGEAPAPSIRALRCPEGPRRAPEGPRRARGRSALSRAVLRAFGRIPLSHSFIRGSFPFSKCGVGAGRA